MEAEGLGATLADCSSVGDEELESLLHRVYVEGGYTDPEAGQRIFRADAVRARGPLLFARDPATGSLAGVVIVASPTSPARRIARPGEAELHLMAVAPQHRGIGIGSLLVREALVLARAKGFERMVLWTQPSMEAAQRLYERFGFVRDPTRDWTSTTRRYIVYERSL